MSQNIAISQFKAHCLEIINKLPIDGQDIIITKRDKPIAKLIPINNTKTSLFGLLKDKAEINGDIITPIDVEWDVYAGDEK